MDRTAAEGADRGYAETLMGRRRYLPELKSPKAPIREFGKRAAMNTPVQGTAADIIKLAMVRTDRALRDAGMRSEWCMSGKEALLRTVEAMQIGDLYKVYIIDWMMPDMNGIETVRRIRKSSKKVTLALLPHFSTL